MRWNIFSEKPCRVIATQHILARTFNLHIDNHKAIGYCNLEILTIVTGNLKPTSMKPVIQRGYRITQLLDYEGQKGSHAMLIFSYTG